MYSYFMECLLHLIQNDFTKFIVFSSRRTPSFNTHFKLVATKKVNRYRRHVVYCIPLIEYIFSFDISLNKIMKTIGNSPSWVSDILDLGKGHVTSGILVYLRQGIGKNVHQPSCDVRHIGFGTKMCPSFTCILLSLTTVCLI